jgi:sulfatase maturation enzyme AslB (radical SAM superfamily)
MDLLECLKSNEVAIATSFYSDIPTIHDSITKVPGSHSATVQTITLLLKSGLKVRAGIVIMEENRDRIRETVTYLHSLGINDIKVDRVRHLVEGVELNQHGNTGITELCGDCWKGRICVMADGTVAPCIMSRDWAVGSVFEEDFSP